MVWHDREINCAEMLRTANAYDRRIGTWVMHAMGCGDIARLDLDESNSMGYTLRTLSGALWAYLHVPNFTTGLVSIVNAGGDADTNAAVACAILGAKFGFRSIPAYYVYNLNDTASYRLLCEQFVQRCMNKFMDTL